jgi:hypothetical protein
MKDAQGHGSNGKGGDAAQTGEQHTMAIAAQHGIPTTHFSPPAYNPPDAINNPELRDALSQLSASKGPGDGVGDSGWSKDDIGGLRAVAPAEPPYPIAHPNAYNSGWSKEDLEGYAAE